MSVTATTTTSPEPVAVEPLDPELLLDIATGLARARALWEGRVRHDQQARHAIRLLAHDHYEVWLIGWPSDHRTTPHDHGGSVGALAVVEGELVERHGAHGTERRSLGAGETVFLPADIVHDVGTFGGPATSIHVYSPPLSTMTFYEDATGLPDHVLDIIEEAPALDPAAAGRALHPSRGASPSEPASHDLLATAHPADAPPTDP